MIPANQKFVIVYPTGRHPIKPQPDLRRTISRMVLTSFLWLVFGCLSLSVRGADSFAPVLIISSPVNGQNVSTASTTIRGTATDSGRGNSGIASVTVNGVRASGDTATGFGTANWSRTITLFPDANKITVIAKDNSSTPNSVTLTITINYKPANTAPTVSSIPNKTIQSDGVATVSFTVNDAETAAGILTLAATSSNTSLISNGNIIFGGSGSTRTVALTPNANQSGTATVTITVKDSGGLSTSTSFLLTVTPRIVVQPPPIIGGTVGFNNRIVGTVDARVLLPDGTGAGAGWTAELLAGPEGGTLTPVSPTTTFRTSSAAAMGYVDPIDVGVPNVLPGGRAVIVMRAFNGSSYETSTLRGQSKPISVTLGGAGSPPSLPATLAGMEGFTVGQSQTSTPPPPPPPPTTSNGGTVEFNNRIVGTVDARVLLPDGTGVGAGWIAELLAGPEGGTLTPVTPTTTFRTSSAAAMGYLNSVDISVPKVAPGARSTLVMRAFNGASYDTSTLRGQSKPITVVLGGAGVPPSLPATLAGMEGFTVGSATPSQTKSFVERQLPAFYAPGLKLTVILKATPPNGTKNYAVEDSPPAGWKVGAVSDNGSYDTGNQKVKWGPFFDAAVRSLSYEVTAPLGETGKREFTGTSAADVTILAVGGASIINSISLHPADNNPADGRLTIGEVTAYGVAWKNEQPWPLPPNPIPADYVTRAGALWKNGEAYQIDSSISTPPLWWVNLPAKAGLQRYGLATATSTGSTASSSLSTLFVPGENLVVQISVRPAAGVSAYAVQDTVPAGWTVAQISDGGSFASQSGQVRWGPFFDNQPRQVSYELASSNQTPDAATFDGSVSFDGASTAITGQRISRATSRLHSLMPLPNGKLQLQVSGRLGVNWKIEASFNLIDWTTVSTTANADGTLQINDPMSTATALRFYRAVTQ